MLTLAIIGFLGGLITGISPCILPVLPVIFFSGGVQGARDSKRRERWKTERGGATIAPAEERAAAASGAPAATTTATIERSGESTDADREPSRWRPYLVILGLVTSFSAATLIGSLVLGFLGLPQDVLRWAGIVVLVLIGIGLIVPSFQHLLEKPFSWIPQKHVGTERGGFSLGLALGVVYVPCAGPVLAAITVAGSTGNIGVETIVLTVTFAIGAAIPLLIFALAGRRIAERVAAFRKRQRGIRITGGVLMMALAIGLVFNVPQLLQQLVPDYTSGLQNQIAESEEVTQALDRGGLVNDENKDLDKCTNGASELERCGTAPSITGIEEWFNTPGSQPIDLADERGSVVLIDFWAYSCINCQRALRHVVAWHERYEEAGLRVIGVHSPEYAFEKVPANVKAGAANFGIEYPVAIDNNLSTWTNYRNRYWPAHYLIDADGTVRHIKLGEGGYDTTERLIRELLVDADPDVALPEATDLEDTTPEAGSTTPETFLGTTKEVNFGGTEQYSAATTRFSFPDDQPADTFALDGAWALDTQSITPQAGEATVRLRYTAQEVRMVLSGSGTITVESGDDVREIDVSGTPTSYELLRTENVERGTLEVTVSPGIEAYSFTFG